MDELIETYQSEFEKTDLYQDIGSYQDMTLLELSKKLPKWKSNYNKFKPKIDENNKWDIVRYVKKHCKDCDKHFIFEKNQCKYIQREFSYVKCDFVRVYIKLFIKLVKEADAYSKSTKSEHEIDIKQRMAEHQNKHITCECGGKYSIRNKRKHIKTNKHTLYCQPAN